MLLVAIYEREAVVAAGLSWSGLVANIYGDRYENTGRTIGGGAQGDVFRVRDILSSEENEFALKRLRNPDRLARFKSEIEALKTIDHPNVMKIVDDSGDPAAGDPKHKYWFVMPIAHENLEDRIGLYKGNLDGVLHVTIQLADALAAAHAQGIVHRDVKPANILFPRVDHDVWLSDFGICHLGTNKPRLTSVGEVVGPRGFTAPELEFGGQVEITPAADLYSLGKVIFYMLSGGNVIAREQLGGPEFLSAFSKSERYALLRTLLARMIAPLDRRIQTAAEVAQELKRIAGWEEFARSLALSPAALASIQAVQQRATDHLRIAAENQRIRRDNEGRLADGPALRIRSSARRHIQRDRWAAIRIYQQGGVR